MARLAAFRAAGSVIHLDTSFLIRSLVGGTAESKQVHDWLLDGQGLAMSAVAWGEFRCGPLGADHTELALRVLSRIDPFDLPSAERAASLFNASGRRRGSFVDCMIAAVAMEAESPLATSNVDDFEPLKKQGLAVILPG